MGIATEHLNGAAHIANSDDARVLVEVGRAIVAAINDAATDICFAIESHR